MPKALKHKTGFHDGMREHHSSFKHPGVTTHSAHDHPEWAHGAEDDTHMSHPGMEFGTSNPDEATHMTGIRHHANPRHEHIHRMLVRK
jgi:hypothetical protein